jgi:hypothetical protein
VIGILIIPGLYVLFGSIGERLMRAIGRGKPEAVER